MRYAIIPLLLLAACSKSSEVADELPNSSLAGAPRENVAESRMDAPLARPVTIGEDGPRLDACGAMGQIARTGSTGLPVRAAPFADAHERARLAEGSRVYICTRSIDQQWLGVVVAPTVDGQASDARPPVDCAVAQPVDRKQAYAGACVSGWVASASIRLIAG